jgi:outer membrane biosynthesis protein TonB
MSREHRPLALALLLSLLIHTLLLSLTFGGWQLGLPGFAFPWRDRRIEVPDLRIALVPAHVAPAELAVKLVAANVPATELKAEAKPRRNAMAPATPAKAPMRVDGPDRAATPPRILESAVIDVDRSEGPTPVVPAAPPAPTPVIALAPSASSPESAMRVDGPDRAAPAAQIQESAVIDVERSERSTPVVPAAPPAPTSVIALAPSASSPETVTPASRDAGDVVLEAARQAALRVEAARLEAERQEAARQMAAQLEVERLEAARQAALRVEAARLEAERQEAARQMAAQLEVERLEAARQAALRVEAARLEAERLEAARQMAAQLEVERLEAARQAALRVEAARLDAERQEAARQMAAQLEVERQEAARQAAPRVEAARLEAERQEAATRREAALRAIGRQLDEEAARREAASTAARPSSTLPLSLSTARRVRLWGRSDPNVELVQYAEAWARKIQFNTTVDTVREVAKRPHIPPMVTVAIRSDGSVELVTFVVSSGVAEVDEAIRRIVQSHAHYQAFPPGLAREFDVVEIRRTWYFDGAVRLY